MSRPIPFCAVRLRTGEVTWLLRLFAGFLETESFQGAGRVAAERLQKELRGWLAYRAANYPDADPIDETELRAEPSPLSLRRIERWACPCGKEYATFPEAAACRNSCFPESRPKENEE